MLSLAPPIQSSCKAPASSQRYLAKPFSEENLYLGSLQIKEQILESVSISNLLQLYDQHVDSNV